MALFPASDAESAHAQKTPGAKWLVVHGRPHQNTAAKFWSRLFDELAMTFPASDRVVLTTTDEGPLDPDELRPEKQLEDDFDRLRGRDLRAMLQDVVTHLELLGPPQPVHASVFAAGNKLASRDLPTGCVDSSVFPYLLVWLLAWAELPHFLWNNACVEGDFCADDVQREITYSVRFVLHNRDVSEGLVERRLNIEWMKR